MDLPSGRVQGESLDRDALTIIIARGRQGRFVWASLSVQRASHQLWALVRLGARDQQYRVTL